MSYPASVYQIMIASPSDVSQEREIIREVIHEWNAIHSKYRGIVLLPIAWESHAFPAMDARPQAIINRQILADADILIAVFWTRLGSPTGESASGTVEEIEKHMAAGKPTMIYFSTQPICPDSVDKTQYEALSTFRETCRQKGLIWSYETPVEFREKLGRQLAQIVQQYFADEEVRPENKVEPKGQFQEIIQTLSKEARELLVNASKDSYGIVAKIASMKELSIQTNNRNFVEAGNPRSEALWEGAIEELCAQDLLRYQGGVVYGVTKLGFEVADTLAAS